MIEEFLYKMILLFQTYLLDCKVVNFEMTVLFSFSLHAVEEQKCGDPLFER